MNAQRNLAERLWLGECALVQIDQPTRDFVALARVALGTADQLEENEPARGHLYNALDEAFKVLDTREPFEEGFYESVPEAYQVLRKGIESAGNPMDVPVTAVGHAHIDVAWLWTLDQTRRKAGRSFYNVLRLMEQFPEYRFVQSQPQLYDYVRQDYPQLFSDIQKRVQSGDWEAIGGMWVEADCNLTGSEPLARQFVLGRQFFKKYFGDDAESPVLWLPDVFGYAWNLPQLIKEAGLEYFFTIKIGWSQYNRLPYDSFWWQGLDGSKVLTHFSPTKEPGSSFASTYNATATPGQVISTWTNFQQKDWGRPGQVPPLLMSYGYGDGGGGPTREMQENLREMARFPAVPRVTRGKVIDFFRELEDKAGDLLPTWNGELYLEYHRGTYTTQSRSKRANRKSEFLLHDVEFLSAMAATLDADFIYPYTSLQQMWELVCLNQFHDILPGSSITDVYRESLQQYAEVEKMGRSIRQAALEKIGEYFGKNDLVINPTSFTRHELLFLQDEYGDVDLEGVRAQKVPGGFMVDVGEMPPYSIVPLKVQIKPGIETGPVQATAHLLENDFLRVEIDDKGDITRIHDKKNGREVLPKGETANHFQAFEDRPKTPDAWEIDIYYDDRVWFAEPATAVRLIEAGPLRATVEITRQILNSEIRQRISLAYNSARLDFDTSVSWWERHIMLKVAFPVDVLATMATYEIQWGNVERPTHRNTSWDWARFETCAQKWVDLSEGDFGVSLLNDCKYGHDIRDNVIRLTLLRGPTDPDPVADLGEHSFTYSLLPHAGPWDERTIAEAYAINDPLILYTADRQRVSANGPAENRMVSFMQVDASNVVIETIKRAEDGEGIIVRLYESQRKRGTFTLACAFAIAEAWRTNLLEENQEQLVIDGNQLSVPIKPYQIITLRLQPK
jgi:alpha-mannosidase